MGVVAPGEREREYLIALLSTTPHAIHRQDFLWVCKDNLGKTSWRIYSSLWRNIIDSNSSIPEQPQPKNRSTVFRSTGTHLFNLDLLFRRGLWTMNATEKLQNVPSIPISVGWVIPSSSADQMAIAALFLSQLSLHMEDEQAESMYPWFTFYQKPMSSKTKTKIWKEIQKYSQIHLTGMCCKKQGKKEVRRKQSEKYSKSKRRKRRSEPSSSGSSCSVTRKIFAIQDTINCTGCDEVYRVYNRRLDHVW